ncbi:MAG: hypothetical protein ACR2H1_02935 [Limisphaerales bacterium]
MEKLFISFAYKYVMLTLMLTEANHALTKLDVPGLNPITLTNIVSYHITAPRMRVGGSLDTTNMMFGFGENKLQFIQLAEPNSDLSIEARHNRWAKQKSLIGTNEAYQLATNWLIKLEVDLKALEKVNPPSVMQQYYYPNKEAGKKIMLPRYEVRWGTNPSRPAVWVSIFGPTKSPIHIRQEDGSFIRRPDLVKIEKIEHLLSITNKEFAGWTIQQKSNLVMQSAGNFYSSLALPEIVSKNEPSDRTPLRPLAHAKENTNALRKKTRTLPPAEKETDFKK